MSDTFKYDGAKEISKCKHTFKYSWTCSNCDIHIQDYVEQLEQQVTKYRTALEKYADEKRWWCLSAEQQFCQSFDYQSNGYEIAAEVLKTEKDI